MAQNIANRAQPDPAPQEDKAWIKTHIALCMGVEPGHYMGTITETGQSVAFPVAIMTLGLKDKQNKDQMHTMALSMPDSYKLVLGVLEAMAKHGHIWATNMLTAHNDILEVMQADTTEEPE